jgi:hypothetical protein
MGFVISALAIYFGIQIKKNETVRYIACRAETEKSYKFLVVKAEQIPLWQCRIKLHIKEARRTSVDWIDMAQDKTE